MQSKERKARLDPHIWESLTEQVETAITTAGGLHNAANWVRNNTRDPRNSAKPFSFKGHEYQIGILNDAHPMLAIRKATQIGASEASLRLALAVSAKFSNISTIYVLPSIRFAQKFAASRANPVIEASPRLKAITNREVSSNELKQIGSSFLHFTGAAQNSSAISIPARALLIDEYAFCDPQVVSVFTSRLGHQAEHEKIVRYFSSPLHPHSDISYLYEQGTQNIYMVYHDACGQWVPADPLEQIILPGYDDPLSSLTYTDIDNPKYDVDSAYVQCPHCHQPITLENLSEPAKRAWVPHFPDRTMASYDANPLVVPHLRTPPLLLRDLKLYKNTARWLQYGLGVPAEASSDMILQSALDTCFSSTSHSPRQGGVYGATLGCDVGKTSHIVVGKQIGPAYHVLWMETQRQTEDGATNNKLVNYYQAYGAVQAVIDAAPDVSMPKEVAGRLPFNCVWGCYFIRGRGKTNLTSWEADHKEGVVKVSRTRALDEFVEAFNRGFIKLPAGLPFEQEVRQHLQRLKRILNYDLAGEESAQWIATDPETHWFFAIFYAWLAQRMAGESSTGIIPGMNFSNLVGRVKMNNYVTRPISLPL